MRSSAPLSDRTIAVTSGCQSAGIAACLQGMLPESRVVIATPPRDGDPAEFHRYLRTSSVWVTSLDDGDVATHRAAAPSAARVISIPNVYFFGFHPDITHLRTADGAVLGSGAGNYSSAIVVEGWRRGESAQTICASFESDSFQRLGYFDAWHDAVAVLRARFDRSDLNFGDWFLPLVRSGTFMLTDVHPTIAALAQLARGVACILGAPNEARSIPWDRVVPDGLLSTDTVWPVYPELARRLGVPGGYLWRTDAGAFIGLEEFVTRSLDRYASFDPTEISSPRSADGVPLEASERSV